MQCNLTTLLNVLSERWKVDTIKESQIAVWNDLMSADQTLDLLIMSQI